MFFDDACYYLSFDREEDARLVAKHFEFAFVPAISSIAGFSRLETPLYRGPVAAIESRRNRLGN